MKHRCFAKGSRCLEEVDKEFIARNDPGFQMEQRKSFHPEELIDSGFLAQSSLGSLHAPRTATKQGSSYPGAPGEDVSPNHCSDRPWIQAGESHQRKHHLFQEQMWNSFAQTKTGQWCPELWANKITGVILFTQMFFWEGERLVPSAEHRMVQTGLTCPIVLTNKRCSAIEKLISREKKPALFSLVPSILFWGGFVPDKLF